MSDFNGQPSHLKGGGVLRQSHTGGLSHSKSRQEALIDGTTGTVGPLAPSKEGCHYKKLSALEIHI